VIASAPRVIITTGARFEAAPILRASAQECGCKIGGGITAASSGRRRRFVLMIKFTDDIYRGSRPTRASLLSAEPNPRTLINLESGWYEWVNRGAIREDQLANDLGMVELHLPMSPFTPPSLAQVTEAYALMNSLELPRPLLVHCREGVDRTGVVCAYYRVVAEGWSPAAAIEEMLSIGFHRWRYLYWLSPIRRLLERAQAGVCR
jgi:predicted protein tyrosine phosphatase